MPRLHQTILIAATLVGSWLLMQAVHELGHVVGAWFTGGQVARVVLHPLTISRTDLTRNPSPLVVVWAGPIIGVVVPVVLWTVGARERGAYVLRFFAGFCLIANGLYIGIGSFNRVGDCDDLLRHGAMMWQLWLFGLVTVPIGLKLWCGQGRHFGLRTAKASPPENSPTPKPLPGQVDLGVTYTTLAICLALLLLGFVAGGE